MGPTRDPVGGRLSHFLPNWKIITADQWILRVIAEGYRLQFDARPPTITHPEGNRFWLHGPKLTAALTAIDKLLEKRAIRELPVSDPGFGFYSPVFLVPKKDSSDLRMIIDLKILNREYLRRPPKFRMESIKHLRLSVQPHDWMISLDLQDAYLHVPIHPASRRYLRFGVNGRLFEFLVLPFGISTAPWLFTKLTAPIMAFLHLQRIRIHGYLDDFMSPNASRDGSDRDAQYLPNFFEHLGFLVHPVKSELTPTQRAKYIGAVFDTQLATVSPPADRYASVAEKIRQLRHAHLTLRSWMSLLGELTALQDLTNYGRLHLRHFQHWINCHRQFDLDTIPLHLTGSTTRSRMVAPRSDHLTGSSSYQEPTGTSHVYRCIPDGMGRPSSRSTDSGSLASRDHRPYQCLRAESCSTCHRQLERSIEKQTCLYCHGQCHSNCLYPKDGRHTVTTDDVLDQTALPIDMQPSDHLISQTHSRQNEHHSRRSIETRQDSLNGMVSTSIGIQVDIPTVGNTSDRSVCNSPKPSTSGLLQPTSGSASVSGRCLNTELEQHDSLCLSSNQPDTGSTTEMSYSQHDTVPGGSSLAGETVVPRPSVSTDRPAAPTANMADVTETTELRPISQQSSNVPSSRLETIQQHMETAGFSTQVSEAVSKSVRPSTSSLYDFKWQRFQQWRVRERRDKQPVSIPMVADFLLYLRLKQGLRHNTLEGYRSALASVLDKQGFNMGTDKVLHDLLRSFEITDITTPRIPLKWDLSVVLSGLMRRTFKPMELEGLPHVAWKTAFLLALATAARVSELHAIDVNTISFTTEPPKAVFKLLPDFMAKNQKSKSLLGPSRRESLPHSSFISNFIQGYAG